MAKLCLSQIFPFNFQSADSLGILGYPDYELIGKSILKLVGPRTDIELLQTLITNTAKQSCNSAAQFILYSSDARCHAMMISFSACTRNTGLDQCLMVIRPSEAVSINTTVEESFCATATVSADPPYIIEILNKRFLERFGCTHEIVNGRSLRFLQGRNCPVWTSLLQTASQGQPARGAASICASWSQLPQQLQAEDVVCMPVVDAPNGLVRHIFIVFAPCMSPASSCDDVRDNGQKRIDAHTVVPRRKAFEEMPVMTREVLDQVSSLPLVQAAAAVGLSRTTFKKACRRLGLRRWKYLRGCKRRLDVDGADKEGKQSPSSSSAAEVLDQSSTAEDSDETIDVVGTGRLSPSLSAVPSTLVKKVPPSCSPPQWPAQKPLMDSDDCTTPPAVLHKAPPMSAVGVPSRPSRAAPSEPPAVDSDPETPLSGLPGPRPESPDWSASARAGPEPAPAPETCARVHDGWGAPWPPSGGGGWEAALSWTGGAELEVGGEARGGGGLAAEPWLDGAGAFVAGERAVREMLDAPWELESW